MESKRGILLIALGVLLAGALLVFAFFLMGYLKYRSMERAISEKLDQYYL
ncbi:MAG: hypothetical protein HY922_10965, partial [Elusimicrobia bacterium]|nr:hypothetical protein [Elusimicrobiota bacterium]